MNRPESPCRRCKKRHAECHGSCGPYKFWQAELELYNEFMRNRKTEDIPQRPEYSDSRLRRMRGRQ